jgi:hypothetical protein
MEGLFYKDIKLALKKLSLNSENRNTMSVGINALFAWFISHQPAVLFSQNKPATSNQPAVLFSQNKPAPAINHQPTEQAVSVLLGQSEQGLIAVCLLVLSRDWTTRKRSNANLVYILKSCELQAWLANKPNGK